MITTFKEIQRRVQQRIMNDDTSTSDTFNDILPKIKVWINERYDRLIKSKPWPERVKKTDLTIVASTVGYGLNRDIDIAGIIAVFDVTNGLPIKRIRVGEHIRSHASALDQTDNVQTGDPTRFYPVGKYTVKAAIGTTAEKANCASLSASDVSPLVVHIKGLVSSVEMEEDVVLTGATAVDSTNTWDASQKLEVSIGTNDGTIPQLNGTVTVKGTTSGTVFTKISEFELVTEFDWIEVSPTPNSSGTMPTWNIWHRRKYQPLVNNNDIPMFDCTEALVQGAYSDALREDGQENESNYADQKYAGLVEELWANSQNPDEIEQFIPQKRDAMLIDDFGRSVYIE